MTLQLSDFNVFQITMGSNTWGIQIGWSMFLMVVFWICFSRFKHVMLEIRIVLLLYDIFILCGRIEDTARVFEGVASPKFPARILDRTFRGIATRRPVVI